MFSLCNKNIKQQWSKNEKLCYGWALAEPKT
jgi:hypothetical protein